MGPYEYLLTKIDGDYAYLTRTDVQGEEPLFIARALLPPEAEEGTRLHYEMFTYTIV
ncbi:MAG: chorismate--pyruvate lyase [Oscillospiraceae bacterium]|nr:chorismate--pyruvate lyase [Oscillospiraceae bacterium]MBQ2791680.1 chorismate--pyruvate lyase [Oscillospiraceae bacterium]MBQ3242086.1 chorismate--pyruvate lyase [Oscillospiraceae bacterium]MBQ7083354.1 chorismate--pyruvate lyase [Oscillospiraceae bacterium]MBR2635731.1 chorismate--pyruvate lyase [Oscillospiraceae bacterium]